MDGVEHPHHHPAHHGIDYHIGYFDPKLALGKVIVIEGVAGERVINLMLI